MGDNREARDRETSLEAIGKVKVQNDNGLSCDKGLEEETSNVRLV